MGYLSLNDGSSVGRIFQSEKLSSAIEFKTDYDYYQTKQIGYYWKDPHIDAKVDKER